MGWYPGKPISSQRKVLVYHHEITAGGIEGFERIILGTNKANYLMPMYLVNLRHLGKGSNPKRYCTVRKCL